MFATRVLAVTSDPDSRRADRLDKRNERPRAGAAVDAAWTLSGSVIGCALVGYLIGEHFEVNPAGALIGLGVGLIVGLYNLAKTMGLFR